MMPAGTATPSSPTRQRRARATVHPRHHNTRKQQQGGGVSSFLSIKEKYFYIVLYGFFLLWGYGLYYIIIGNSNSSSKTSSSLGNFVNNNMNDPLNKLIHHSNSAAAAAQVRRIEQQQQHPNNNDNNKSNNPLRYYGWQPKILPKTCSWRDCFKKDKMDHCTTCRQGMKELGDMPDNNAEKFDADTDNNPPDVTVLRRMMIEGKDANGNVWPPPLDDPELCEPIGPAGGTRDINRDLLLASNITAQPLVLMNNDDNDNKGPKIMCLIYTMVENHPTNVRAIRETWAGGCDGFLAFSTETDLRIPAISIPHEGEESYNNMWQKVRSMWKYVGKHYLEDFDYFFIGGEDLYVMPQNLRAYLATLGDSSEELHFVGRRFKGYGHNNYFNSGGAGYALSRGTLRKLYHEGLDHSKCHPTRTTSMEDVMVASCLRDVFDIGLTDTRDSEKRERFHPFAPGTHYTWEPPSGSKDSVDWYADYNEEWGVLLGKDCCAPDSVSFHYMKKPAMVRHIHALLYYCNNNNKDNKKVSSSS